MEWSFSRDTSSKFQSKTEIFHVMSPLNKISSSRNSRNPSIESWDEVTPHWSDGDNVRSEFPVKDTFSIGIQTIHKCTPEKGSQYHNMMIKNKHTQTIGGYRLFMKSASQQTLPISCTCVNSKKKKKKKTKLLNQVCHIRLYVLVMSRTRFRVNLHSIVAWMSRNSLLKTGAKSEV